ELARGRLPGIGAADVDVARPVEGHTTRPPRVGRGVVPAQVPSWQDFERRLNGARETVAFAARRGFPERRRAEVRNEHVIDDVRVLGVLAGIADVREKFDFALIRARGSPGE